MSRTNNKPTTLVKTQTPNLVPMPIGEKRIGNK